MKKIPLIIFLLTFCALSSIGQTQGALTKYNFWHSGCEVSEAAVSWQMSKLNDEILISGSFEWYSGSDLKDCKISSSGILLKVVSEKFPETYGYILLKPQINSSGKIGYQLTSRYSWSRLICDNKGSNCWTAIDAKHFWKGDFEVTDWILLN